VSQQYRRGCGKPVQSSPVSSLTVWEAKPDRCGGPAHGYVGVVNCELCAAPARLPDGLCVSAVLLGPDQDRLEGRLRPQSSWAGSKPSVEQPAPVGHDPGCPTLPPPVASGRPLRP